MLLKGPIASKDTMPGQKCICGNMRSKGWHLACDECWALLPEDLKEELWKQWSANGGMLTKGLQLAQTKVLNHIYSLGRALRAEPS